MPRAKRGPNRSAAEDTIRALKAGGRIETADRSLIALLQTTADLLDAAITSTDEAAYSRAALGRLHLATIQTLTGKGTADSDSSYDALIGALSTPLGYPAEQPT